MKTSIYHLIDSAGLVRYVGRTTNPRGRLGTYRRGCEVRRPVDVWFQAEMKAGRTPEMEVLCECDGDGIKEEAEEREAVRECPGCGRDHGADEECPVCVWWSGLVRCRICSHEWAAVVPVPRGTEHECPPENLTCPNCGNAAGDAVAAVTEPWE